ncbi:mucin-2 isoform X2 [Fopius arisanus]|uniref:Mucin-2 isoform X2 n=1 Tax=Fopius arisanus TaxID=64838 RepID=A0A9R1TLX7_9HYME|nr:PREDICTED: mucin-2 isoform X2 [Fopius arisanus]
MSSKYSNLFIIFACVSVSLGQVYKSSGIDSNNAVEVAESNDPEANKSDFITQTVYGFLDFTTTIGNTVMVFSPQSAPPEGEKPTSAPVIETKPPAPKKHIEIQPSKTHKSDNGETKKPSKNTKIIVNSVIKKDQENPEPAKSLTESTKAPVLSTVVQVVADGNKPVKNNLAEPEYDYLSKQPTEVVDETYKLINLRPSSKAPVKPRPSPKKEKENPTGLVTRLGGTIVKDGLTTVHETSVLGTYINGKYAQVLQSTSRIVKGGTPAVPEAKIRPTNSQRILKTIGPQHGKLKPQLEPTPAHQQEESSVPVEGPGSKTTRRHTAPHARPKFRNKIYDDGDNFEAPQQPRIQGKNRATTSRPSYKNRVLTTTTTEASVSRRRSGFRPNNSQPFTSPSKPIRPKPEQNSNPNPMPKIKLPRTQGRWSYKTTPKPRIAIRKQVDDEERVSTLEPVTNEPTITTTDEKTPLSFPPAQKKIQEGGTYDDELDPSETEEVSSTSVQSDQPLPEHSLPVETLNVEISTPADFNDVYFEIATIKSPYAFQVGTMKNTRYITVTSTMKKTFATAEPTATSTPTEPLTENILANTGAAYESSLPLDSSVATLPAITLESNQATPPLETLTETFTTTQTLLKTHLLPVVAAGNTSTITLVQTYNIARMVTATKTLPPSEIYQFIPSKTLNEFNTKLDEAGSELHLELDFGDDDRDDEDIPKRIVVPNSDVDDLDVFRSSGKPKEAPTTSAPEPQLTPEQAQQLALLKYFGQPPPATPQVPQLPQVPLFQQQPQFTVTSAPFVTQTLATVSDSRVLKLTFGAKTAYTTLFSTKVVPTEITTYVTTTLPVQPTVPAFPGYYPPPVGYPQFPFVG